MRANLSVLYLQGKGAVTPLQLTVYQDAFGLVPGVAEASDPFWGMAGKRFLEVLHTSCRIIPVTSMKKGSMAFEYIRPSLIFIKTLLPLCS